jgi:hypothetical protein
MYYTSTVLVNDCVSVRVICAQILLKLYVACINSKIPSDPKIPNDVI